MNLDKANKLIEKIAQSDNNITPASPADMPLFNEFLSQEPHTYGNSWTYVVQSKYGIGPYGLGYKYYDGTNLSSVSIYPKMENPDLLCFYWTRPMGPQILDIISKYSAELLDKYSTPTFLKKIFKEQFHYLQKKGFKETSYFPWHSKYPSEDDTYPEIIIDAKATVNNYSNSETLKYSLKRYRNLLSRVRIIKIGEESLRMKAWKVADEFFRQQIPSLADNISTSFDYYNVIFKSLYPGHELFLIEEKTKERGVFDLNKLDEQYYSIYMSLMLREKIQNLNEFSIIYRCHEILQKGGVYLNMGGSETKGLHNFKNKFSVARQNQMYWAAYY